MAEKSYDIYAYGEKVKGTLDDAHSIRCDVEDISAKNVNGAMNELSEKINVTNGNIERIDGEIEGITESLNKFTTKSLDSQIKSAIPAITNGNITYYNFGKIHVIQFVNITTSGRCYDNVNITGIPLPADSFACAITSSGDNNSGLAVISNQYIGFRLNQAMSTASGQLIYFA